MTRKKSRLKHNKGKRKGKYETAAQKAARLLAAGSPEQLFEQQHNREAPPSKEASAADPPQAPVALNMMPLGTTMGVASMPCAASAASVAPNNEPDDIDAEESCISKQSESSQEKEEIKSNHAHARASVAVVSLSKSLPRPTIIKPMPIPDPPYLYRHCWMTPEIPPSSQEWDIIADVQLLNLRLGYCLYDHSKHFLQLPYHLSKGGKLVLSSGEITQLNNQLSAQPYLIADVNRFLEPNQQFEIPSVICEDMPEETKRMERPGYQRDDLLFCYRIAYTFGRNSVKMDEYIWLVKRWIGRSKDYYNLTDSGCYIKTDKAPEVICSIARMFQGHDAVILGFNNFLAEDDKQTLLDIQYSMQSAGVPG
jgi:hypothetical protein